MNASPSNKHVRAVVEVVWEMHQWTPVRGRLSRLKSGNLKSQVGECGFPLTRELEIRWRDVWEHLSWDGEAFAVH